MNRFLATTLILALTLSVGIHTDLTSPAWAKKKKDTVETQLAPEESGEEKPGEESEQETETPAPDPGPSAVDIYNRGVELFQIGQIQAEKGNRNGQKDLLKQAIKNFEQALQMDPALVEAQSNIGFAYLTLKDRKRAIKAFQKALEIDNQHLNTLNGLSTVYALNGEIQESITTFQHLIELDPGNPQYFFNMGSVLQKAGRTEDSLKAYQGALHLDPEDQRSLFNTATLLENLGKYEEAQRFYRRAKDVNISNSIGLEAINRLHLLDQALKNQQEQEPAPLEVTPELTPETKKESS